MPCAVRGRCSAASLGAPGCAGVRIPGDGAFITQPLQFASKLSLAQTLSAPMDWLDTHSQPETPGLKLVQKSIMVGHDESSVMHSITFPDCGGNSGLKEAVQTGE